MDWLTTLGLPYQLAAMLFYSGWSAICLVLISLLALALCIFIPAISRQGGGVPEIYGKLARVARSFRRRSSVVLRFHTKSAVPTYSEGVKMLRSLSKADFEHLGEQVEKLQFRLTRKFVDPLQQSEDSTMEPQDNSRAIKRQETLESIQRDLSSLSKLVDQHNAVEVPALQLNDQDHDRRRQGGTTLIVFAPLLIFVIILNTYLLSMFFHDLLGANDTSPLGFGVPIKLSHIIAFMFTSIEVGIGIYFGTTEYNPPKSSSVTAVIKTFGWTILLMLAVVEFTIYFLLSFGVKPYELVRILADYSVIELAAEGWMALFGPIIVMALFIFGHQVCYAFLQVRHTDSLHRLQTNLDTTDVRLEGITERVEGLSKRITELKEAELTELRFSNPATEQLSENELKALNDKREAEIKDIESSLANFVSSLREIAAEIPEKNDKIEHEKMLLPFREQVSFFATDFLVGLLSVSSLVGFAIVGQLLWSIVEPTVGLNSNVYVSLLVSACLGSIFLVAGHFIFQSFNLTVDQGRLLVRSSPSQVLLKVISALLVVCTLSIMVWAVQQSQSNWMLLSVFILLGLGLLLLGNRLVISIFAIRTGLQLLLLYSGRYITLLVLVFAVGLVEVKNTISKLLFGLAEPWFKLFPALAK
jgi:HAMP domain-containing protein